MEPGETCRVCDSCKSGKYEVRLENVEYTDVCGSHYCKQLCPDIIFAATPPYDGTLARYYRLAADLAYPLPDNLTLEDGAMVRHHTFFSIFLY